MSYLDWENEIKDKDHFACRHLDIETCYIDIDWSNAYWSYFHFNRHYTLGDVASIDYHNTQIVPKDQYLDSWPREIKLEDCQNMGDFAHFVQVTAPILKDYIEWEKKWKRAKKNMDHSD